MDSGPDRPDRPAHLGVDDMWMAHFGNPQLDEGTFADEGGTSWLLDASNHDEKMLSAMLDSRCSKCLREFMEQAGVDLTDLNREREQAEFLLHTKGQAVDEPLQEADEPLQEAWADDFLDTNEIEDQQPQHPLLGREYKSFVLADRDVRTHERGKGRDVFRLTRGHGANGEKAVLVCRKCGYDNVRYVIKEQLNGKWLVTEALSRHGPCIPGSRSATRILRGDFALKSTIMATAFAPLPLKSLQAQLAGGGKSGQLSAMSTASRFRSGLLREAAAAEDSTASLLFEYVPTLVSSNAGSYAELHLAYDTEDDDRVLTYENDRGELETTDTWPSSTGPVKGARLRRLIFVPGTSVHLLRAAVPVLSIDYGRQLIDEGGGIVVVVAEVAEKLVPVAMNWCEIETANEWSRVLKALRKAGGAALALERFTVIGDRLTGSDEAIAEACPNWDRVYCLWHLLMNLHDKKNVADGSGGKLPENDFWNLVNARNVLEFEKQFADFRRHRPAHAQYLAGVDANKYLFCKFGSMGVMVGETKSSRAELEFARGKKNGSRRQRGAYVLLDFAKNHADALQEIKRRVGELQVHERVLMPKAMVDFNKEVTASMKYRVDTIQRRNPETHVPEAGLVCRYDADGSRISAYVDLIGTNNENGEQRRGHPDTGYCGRCHKPDVRGMPCGHIIQFIKETRRPTEEEQMKLVNKLYHTCFRVAAIKEHLDTAREFVVHGLDEAGGSMHQIAPLVGKRGPGRPPKVKGKAGRKRNEHKRILSNGEKERAEARKEARTAERADAIAQSKQ
jgi:hypothetical protein